MSLFHYSWLRPFEKVQKLVGSDDDDDESAASPAAADALPAALALLRKALLLLPQDAAAVQRARLQQLSADCWAVGVGDGNGGKWMEAMDLDLQV